MSGSAEQRRVEAAVRAHFTALMNKRTKKMLAAALHDLYHGPSGSGPGYTTALKHLNAWWSDWGQTLWFERDSEYLLEEEPKGYKDEETGDHIDPDWDNYYEIDRARAKRIVFGALVTDGGM